MIPRILHRTVPADVPPEWDANWDRWRQMHPDWQHITWSDPLDPDDWELGHLHPHCRSGAQLAGLVRLEAIWRHGGVYVDADFEPLRPLDDLLAHPLFIGTEDGQVLTDALFGAEPGHPGLRRCINRVAAMDMAEGAWATGPGVTTAELTGRPGVTILAARCLYPYHYSEPHRRHEDFATTTPEAWAVHHWAASWQTGRKRGPR